MCKQQIKDVEAIARDVNKAIDNICSAYGIKPESLSDADIDKACADAEHSYYLTHPRCVNKCGCKH